MTLAAKATADDDAFVDLLCTLRTNPLAAIPRDHPGAEMWQRHRTSVHGRSAMDHPHTRLFDEALEAAHQRHEELAEHPLFKFRVTLNQEPAPQSRYSACSGQSEATAAESAIDEWATADGPYELVDIHDEIVKDSAPAAPGTPSTGEPHWNPLLPDGGLAEWPANNGNPYAKRVSAAAARTIVEVDPAAFNDRGEGQCRDFGSVGRTGRSVTGGTHPCRRSTCMDCAVQWAVGVIGHLHALWEKLPHVHLTDISPSAEKTFKRRLSRARAQHFTVRRDGRVLVFSNTATTGSQALSPGEALQRVQTALALPFIGERRVDCSKGWKPPEHPKRDETYATGLDHAGIDKFFETAETKAIEEYGQPLSSLEINEMGRICRAVAAEVT